MYIQWRLIFFFKSGGRRPRSVIVLFGCGHVYCSMQHLHFGEIFIKVGQHILSVWVPHDSLTVWVLCCPMGWPGFPLAHCKHASHSQLMPHSSVSDQWGPKNGGSFIISKAQNIFTIWDLRQTDKLFLLVSVLCVPRDSVFKETALKRSLCLMLLWHHRMTGFVVRSSLVMMYSLFCCCLLSQHIYQHRYTVRPHAKSCILSQRK
jgi:hypothetical protein